MECFGDAGKCLSEAVIAQLVARRSHNPKVVSSILTHRITILCGVSVERHATHGCATLCRAQVKRNMQADLMLQS